MWHFELEHSIHGDLRIWALDPGSTCLKCENLKIYKTSTSLINKWPMFEIYQPGFLRTSLLYLDNQPWMFAQAWTASANQAFIVKLKSQKPLGLHLFKNSIKRSTFKFAKPKHFKELVQPQTPIVARYSYFSHKSAMDLLLLEVFLQHKMWK